MYRRDIEPNFRNIRKGRFFLMRKTEINIDWLTVTMNPEEVKRDERGRFYNEFYKRDWTARAEALLDIVANKLRLDDSYFLLNDEDKKYIKNGVIVEEDVKIEPKLRKGKGYTVERQYKGAVIGYHPLYEYMGLAVEMSGSVLDEYRKRMIGLGMKDECIESYVISSMHSIASEFQSGKVGMFFKSQCTRIDIAIDEFGCGYAVTDFINEYHNKQGIIMNTRMSKKGELIETINRSETSIIHSSAGGGSLYVGSMKSDTRLNVYDKAAQTGQNFPQGWVRFEGRFKNGYALQIGNELMGYKDEFRALKYMYSVISQKYAFKLEDGSDHPLVEEWKKRSKGTLGVLRSEDRRKSDFETSFFHLVERSGLYSTMKKAELLFGTDGVQSLVEALLIGYEEYNASEDVKRFALEHEEDHWFDVLPIPWRDIMIKRIGDSDIIAEDAEQ